MTGSQVGAVLHQIRTLAGKGAQGPEPDGQLLTRFAEAGDPSAFEALVARHGPMVLGVCRSVLHHHHDAEDAFQATFLTLARKAGAIRQRPSLAG
jgi:RNA polymerase sigma-70 factor (ECF subfamily)